MVHQYTAALDYLGHLRPSDREAELGGNVHREHGEAIVEVPDEGMSAGKRVG